MSGRIAFYGSLLRSFGEQQRLKVQARLRYLGKGRLAGRLYDLGRYPGLVAGDGDVRVELYQPLDAEVIPFLDRFEGYDSARPETSQYLRERIDLFEPEGLAWIYVYNRSVEGRPWVRSGCWESYWRKIKSGGEPGL